MIKPAKTKSAENKTLKANPANKKQQLNKTEQNKTLWDNNNQYPPN